MNPVDETDEMDEKLEFNQQYIEISADEINSISYLDGELVNFKSDKPRDQMPHYTKILRKKLRNIVPHQSTIFRFVGYKNSSPTMKAIYVTCSHNIRSTLPYPIRSHIMDQSLKILWTNKCETCNSPTQPHASIQKEVTPSSNSNVMVNRRTVAVISPTLIRGTDENANQCSNKQDEQSSVGRINNQNIPSTNAYIQLNRNFEVVQEVFKLPSTSTTLMIEPLPELTSHAVGVRELLNFAKNNIDLAFEEFIDNCESRNVSALDVFMNSAELGLKINQVWIQSLRNFMVSASTNQENLSDSEDGGETAQIIKHNHLTPTTQFQFTRAQSETPKTLPKTPSIQSPTALTTPVLNSSVEALDTPKGRSKRVLSDKLRAKVVEGQNKKSRKH